jgi:hypothetical protein
MVLFLKKNYRMVEISCGNFVFQTLLLKSHMNCFKNSVATSRPRVFTDSFSSLISLSMSYIIKKQMFRP